MQTLPKWFKRTDLEAPNFLWKVLSGALPIAGLLSSREIKVDTRCQIYGTGGESINHMLFTCSLARHVWAMSLFPYPNEGFNSLFLFSNFYYLLVVAKNLPCPIDIRRLFPWLLWYLWTNMNGLNFDGKVFLAPEVAAKVSEEMNQWFQAQVFEIRELVPLNPMMALDKKKWKLPPFPWLKCNIGVAWFKRNKLAGASWVLRDSNSKVILHSRRILLRTQTVIFLYLINNSDYNELLRYWVSRTTKLLSQWSKVILTLKISITIFMNSYRRALMHTKSIQKRRRKRSYLISLSKGKPCERKRIFLLPRHF